MKRKLGVAVILMLCIVWQARAAVNCTATGIGRFANTDDTTCKNYTLCVYNTVTGSFYSYNYVCPSTSLFNRKTGKCTAPNNYVCRATTIPDDTTSICTQEGNIANPADINCTSFLTCLDNGNGTFTSIVTPCPEEPVASFFNPNTTFCEIDYVCSIAELKEFQCSAVGRFANAVDKTCQSYFMCVRSNNGTYIKYQYNCPTTSVFNPSTKLCTTRYTC